MINKKKNNYLLFVEILTAVKIDLISSTDTAFFRISVQDRNACYSCIIVPAKFYRQRICFARTSACERVCRQKEPDDPDYPFTLDVLSVFENDNPFTVLSLDRESFSRLVFQNRRLLSPFFTNRKLQRGLMPLPNAISFSVIVPFDQCLHIGRKKLNEQFFYLIKRIGRIIFKMS